MPHDDLELQIPIFDTGCAFISERVFAVSNGFGQLRQYDYRASRKITSNAQITKKEMLLSHVVSSKVDPNYLYVITQEGHPIQLDRRFNCRVVRKMPGAKGSVRDCKLISGEDHELVVTVGCDRHVRVFDPRQ